MSFNITLVGDKVLSTQQSFFEDSKATLDSKGISVSFEPNEYTKNIKGQGFVIVQDGKVLTSASNISTKHNWINVFSIFADNYKNTDAIDGYYAWGQIVPETGDYLCKDCGFITEFEAGSIFPICEVCQAGEPDGPCGVDEGYWEKL